MNYGMIEAQKCAPIYFILGKVAGELAGFLESGFVVLVGFEPIVMTAPVYLRQGRSAPL